MPLAIYTVDQVSAVCALLALTPRPRYAEIVRITGVSLVSVQYYASNRAKPIASEWAKDVIAGITAERQGDNMLAAYNLVSAAKRLIGAAQKNQHH